MTAGNAPSCTPFGDGTVSLGLHPTGARASDVVDCLLRHARDAAAAGFDGVTLGEHHAGMDGYVPVPLAACSWVLGETEGIWAAPSPLLLPARTVGSVIEQVAWLSVRHPGRVGVGVAPGYLPDDYAAVDGDFESRGERFSPALDRLGACLGGRPPSGPLGRDPAVRSLADHPVPVLATAAGQGGARRAARAGVGILIGAFSSPDEVQEILRAYRESGGDGPRVLIRRAWIGAPTRQQLDGMLAPYLARGGSDRFLREKGTTAVVHSKDAAAVGEGIADQVQDLDITSMNLRLTLPDIDPSSVSEQICLAGRHVVSTVRRALGAGPEIAQTRRDK